jgi:diguanylate cyclase (GGDEF)-like protein
MVNDRFGHLYGDEVLILVANILRSSFRSHDRIFRFGGEEFVVLLRSTTLCPRRTRCSTASARTSRTTTSLRSARSR